ncbi:hypothetical protein DS745_07640 [Anaerobacillus alkaliphilus]|uniref:O-antigen ligase domain-containing protein n=1 Tax=Anaerobacillus alkaliphilus TaxID=1548597 RepID=A0A4Q0VVZ1_9BACI|nr:hypothetical protein [Anaerobacillus alkaliphilus]RXJ02252.1 hypothetical protein DS745_07640 [Anaerobacillus alkaliphilus]
MNNNINSKKNIAFLNCLVLVIFISPLLNILNTSLIKIINLTNTSIITSILYLVVLIICMYHVVKYRNLTIKRLLVYFMFLIFFFLHYIFFETSRQYLVSVDMLIIYLFYIPISIFLISGITDWKDFKKIAPKYGKLTVIISTLGITVVGIQEHISYMAFSYSILPFLAILYYSFRENKSIIDLVFFAIGLIGMVFFGARGPILFLLLFICLYEMITFNYSKGSSRLLKLTIFLLFGFVFFLINNWITSFLSNSTIANDSRFLSKIMEGELTNSNARTQIYIEARSAIENMGVSINGLFWDRYVVNASYVHNVFYELLLSFGLIFGAVFIILLLLLIAKTTLLKRDKSLRILSILFVVSFFLRFIISGSFIIEGNFYLFIALLLNIKSQKEVTKI